MFKSIYTKYLVSFIALLGLGFVAIAIIMSSILTGYSMDTKSDLMYQTANIVYTNIKSGMSKADTDFVQTVKENTAEFRSIFEPLSKYSDSIILVIDGEGNILLKTGEDAKTVKKSVLDKTVISDIVSGSKNYKYSTYGALFSGRRFNYSYPVRLSGQDEDKMVGAIILSSPSSSLAGIFEQITKIIIIASLWVFFAAVVAVYFITSRVTSPLKSMSEAAKSYSKGDFDVKVPVDGSDEIASLATAFNQMAESLKTLEDTRNTFLSNISHDLRTPMTSIQGFIDGILDGTIPPDKQRYYLKIVSGEVKRLSRLVNQLLDISRMESGNLKVNKIKFDVCEVARLILISFEEKIDDKKINIEFDADYDPSEVFADKDAIHQILYNLIDNAIKFTSESGTIKINIRDGGEKYLVSVYNTGLGIKAEELPRVFDRFYKTDSSRGLDKTGTGLGLYIVKTKLEAHGERITVSSEYGKYCEFVFTLLKNRDELKSGKTEEAK